MPVMAENRETSDSMPILCLTPLYNFSSDEPKLVIGRGIRISRYSSDDLSDLVDEEVGKHLQVYEPDYLLWHDPVLTGDVLGDQLVSLLKDQNADSSTSC